MTPVPPAQRTDACGDVVGERSHREKDQLRDTGPPLYLLTDRYRYRHRYRTGTYRSHELYMYYLSTCVLYEYMYRRLPNLRMSSLI